MNSSLSPPMVDFCVSTELSFLIELKLDVPIFGKVNGKCRDSQNRFIQLDQLRDEFSTLIHENPTGNTQISVEPGVPDSSTVGLHTNLDVSFSLLI
ncbi:hypothetical protein OGAPHI_005961 [Ogataea philodendri]|uniref:Uncharacterized protein n=1 Tax=Ogataea philodendri TaxID=1378263 RepID=A0A9P8NXM4_9ASCO|nr:uncharacterized protein OGAPHI_005961 [Ogataea philodendri]KAH3661783.1 hypothetical protein OGAPHI_005961 [Ogataea philodendri]